MTGTRRTIETPWGTDVEVDVVPDGAGGERLVWSHAATALHHGIYGAEKRAAFVLDAEDAERAGGTPSIGELLVRYHWIPNTPRPLPAALPPVYPALVARLPKPDSQALDSWCARVSGLPGWRQRAPALLSMIDGVIRAGSRPGPGYCDEPSEMGARITRTLTAVLEHLNDPAVDRIEVAAFYALSEHPEWRRPALHWIMDCRQSWWRDWIRERPDYRLAAKLAALHMPFLPTYLWRW
ncbi:hypothetical protein [Azospirillum sp. B510]|uniref:hypothetical protein n=1 Tax=Azospirillum sp. (strain B510) TaxID=137722 RepID=UPI0002F17E3D|nr:hypothetical protein [Azospirillum sp. B510]